MKTKTEKSRPRHVTTGDVFEDLGFAPAEAAVLRFKAKLHVEILKLVESQKLTSRDLEKRLCVPQPRVSELLTGKISKMSSDKLAKYLFLLGAEVNFDADEVQVECRRNEEKTCE